MTNALITLTKRCYELQNSKTGEKIRAEIHGNGLITLRPGNGGNRFLFNFSDPKRVKRIATLMLRAVELVKWGGMNADKVGEGIKAGGSGF